jgi:hypothetical protein
MIDAMLRRLALTVFLLASLGAMTEAQSGRLVRVDVQFRQVGSQGRDAVGAAGGVVVTERGNVRPRGRAATGSTETKSTRTTGVFTLVQDGGESTLVVASQVPYQQVTYWRDYASGAGHLTAGVVFRDVGTALKVRASILPDNRIRVRLTPSISWLSADGSGTIEFTEAASDVIVPNGQPVVLAGSTTQTNEVTRQLLGITRAQSSGETTVVLTATARP